MTATGKKEASGAVITLNDVKVHYPVKEGVLQRISGHVRAVDGISLSIPRGKTLGLVGESGCGKTTLGRVIAGLAPATDGDLWFNLDTQKQQEVHRLRGIAAGDMGQDDEALWKSLQSGHRIGAMAAQQQSHYRRNCQMVFQDSFSSLNPRQLVREIVGRPLKVHKVASGDELDQRIVELLERVGLGSQHLLRYPHQFSGGQRQRISIARALALNPEFVILDEPTSALDVSVQAQILNLLVELQQDLNLTYLFITHDLGVVQHMADEIAVMYLGQIAEYGPTEQVFHDPLHPYSKVLRDSNPTLDDDGSSQGWELSGTVPNPIDPPKGCRLHPRCPVANSECGWSVADALGTVDLMSPTLLSGVESVTNDGDFRAIVTLRDEVSAAEFERLVRESSAHHGFTQAPITNGRSVSLTYQEIPDAHVRPIRDGRSTSCLRVQQIGVLPEIEE